MNPPIEPEPNPSPPEQSKTLFGALAGQIKIHIECIEEWNAAKEGVRWEAATPSDLDEHLTPEEQYMRGYQLCPETEEELGWTSAGLGVQPKSGKQGPSGPSARYDFEGQNRSTMAFRPDF